MRKFYYCFFLVLFSIQGHAQWNTFGSGTSGYIIGFENFNGQLLAYSFPSNNIFGYDGKNWNKYLPTLPNSNGIHKLQIIDSILYAGVYASTSNNSFWYLKNNQWVALGGVFKNAGSQLLPSIYDIAVYKNEIYVCGEFNRIDNDTIKGIAKWNGAKWEGLGKGVERGMPPNDLFVAPHQMLVYNDKLVLVGNFQLAGGLPANGIAAWDGTQWNSFSNGFNNGVDGAGIYKGELYAGGAFTASGTTPLNYIAKWDGSNWISPGFGFSKVNGSNPYIHTLMEINNTFYISGSFNRVTATGQIAKNAKGIIAFDGTTVDTLYGGVNNDVEGIYPYKNGILVGGNFNKAGNVIAYRIAWLQTGASSISTIHSDTDLFVYPSICDDWLYIPTSENPLKYSIYAVTGQKIQEGFTIHEINVEQLQAGMYIIVLNVDQQRVTKKFLKE